MLMEGQAASITSHIPNFEEVFRKLAEKLETVSDNFKSRNALQFQSEDFDTIKAALLASGNTNSGGRWWIDKAFITKGLGDCGLECSWGW